MQTLWQDLRYGARILLKNAGFTLIAVMTLAPGVGANTAIFSLTDQILLRLLPVERPAGPRRQRLFGLAGAIRDLAVRYLSFTADHRSALKWRSRSIGTPQGPLISSSSLNAKFPHSPSNP
jgi:hypothetical protein